MEILCNYISFEVLQALRHINSLVFTAYLGGKGGGLVMTNFISQVGETEAPLVGGTGSEL